MGSLRTAHGRTRALPRGLLSLTGAVAAAAALLGTTACSPSPAEGDGPAVVAAFYPLQYAAERIGGDRVRVTTVVRPGVEPHEAELSARQVAEVADADLVVYLRGFQPAVDEAVEEQAADRALDVAGTQSLRQGFVPLEGGEFHDDERGTDPHFWLDPTRLARVGDALADRLASLDPGHADTYRANAASLRGTLEALDAEYRQGLATCARKAIVVSHNAFGYLAARYGLTQVPISGLTPEDEPTPGRVARVARFAREQGAEVVFFETLASPRLAEALAAEAGARTAVLDPVEGLSADDAERGRDYPAVMRDNLAALRDALDCR